MESRPGHRVNETLLSKLKEHGQGHLIAAWETLDEISRRRLEVDLQAVDLELVAALYRQGATQDDWAELARRAEPPKAYRLNDPAPRQSPQQARARGAEVLDSGRIAALLVAGGQGTRLGFDHPKGMYPIGPVTDRSLFQIHIEKLRAVARRHGTSIPLFLMTSPATHEPTLRFLDQHERFGLPAADLFPFCQGTMPAVDAVTGELLMAEPGRLFQAPDGHGGMLKALAQSGGLDLLQRRGIEHLFYFQVDNPLTPICDDALLGYHLLERSELTTLAVAKHSPEQRVGNVVLVDGKVRILEYSDLPDDVAGRRDAGGSLRLWAGNTAIHVMQVDFLVRMSRRDEALPFHVARKMVPHVTPSGERVDPAEPNALKFERFIFDLLPSAARALVVEGDEWACFAPLKNASGAATDTPESVRRQLTDVYRKWMVAAGAEVQHGIPLEISPLAALDAQDLARRLRMPLQVNEPLELGEANDVLTPYRDD
ncbi:MAG: UTP--glucose-1-phosphate uridylyltransferase [Pirellulales bacterium]